MKRTPFIYLIVTLFSILFLYTGISKFGEFSVLREQIASITPLVPVASYAAVVLPWIEFGTVVLLIIPRLRLMGLYVCMALMILFTGYIIAYQVYEMEGPCGCGGKIELLSPSQHLALNCLLIILAAIGAVLQKRKVKKIEGE